MYFYSGISQNTEKRLISHNFNRVRRLLMEGGNFTSLHVWGVLQNSGNTEMSNFMHCLPNLNFFALRCPLYRSDTILCCHDEVYGSRPNPNEKILLQDFEFNHYSEFIRLTLYTRFEFNHNTLVSLVVLNLKQLCFYLNFLIVC